MIWLLFLSLPLMTSALFAGALFAIWRRRGEALHARSWCASFAMIAIGWILLAGGDAALDRAHLFAATSSLCWLAAALALVHGLRQRAQRSDRSGVLAAIWVAIALALALINDIAPLMVDVTQPTVALLTALGLLLGAVAVGPRRAVQRRLVDWGATGLLAALAFVHLVLTWAMLMGRASMTMLVVGVAMAATIAYVALGLAAVLLLNRDLCVALERLARTDPLTGVWNRRGFDEAAPHLLARLRAASGALAAVAIADIDSFKAINDRFGHTTGDQVLSNFATLLVHAVRPGDLLARLGGEEFALLAIGVDALELFRRVEEVRGLVGVPQPQLSGLPAITSSFGVAQLDARTLSLRDALERADHALYQAKREGRNRSVLDQASTLPPA